MKIRFAALFKNTLNFCSPRYCPASPGRTPWDERWQSSMIRRVIKEWLAGKGIKWKGSGAPESYVRDDAKEAIEKIKASSGKKDAPIAVK